MVSGSLQHFGEVNDLPEYYAGAKLLLHNEAGKIYNLPAFYEVQKQLFPSLARGIGLFLPPLAVPLLVPIAALPLGTAPQVWTAILSVATVGALFLIARYFGLQRQGLAWMLGLAMLSGPVIEGVRIGQLAPLLILALAAFMWFARANRVIGAGLAIAFFVLKPQQMFPMAIFLIGNRKYRLLGIAAAAVIALTLISLPLFGIDGYIQYVKTVSDKSNLVAMQPELNATLRGQMMRFFGTQSSVPTIIGLAGLLCSAAYAFFIGNRFKGSPRWIDAALVGVMPLGLVTSMHCHDYDLVLLIPCIVAVAALAFQQKNRFAFAALLFAVPFLQPFYADIHYTMLLKQNSLINLHFIALLLLSLACASIVLTAPTDTPEPQ
jgi:hypothetical protein